MSMTDPISDLLTRVRNAQMARHRTVTLPISRMKTEIVKIMKHEGYIDGFLEIPGEPQGSLEIELRYNDETPVIAGMKRVSRPGRRVYSGKDSIPKVLDGLGITIVSTPQGVMTGSECARRGIGGEVLCNIW